MPLNLNHQFVSLGRVKFGGLLLELGVQFVVMVPHNVGWPAAGQVPLQDSIGHRGGGNAPRASWYSLGSSIKALV